MAKQFINTEINKKMLKHADEKYLIIYPGTCRFYQKPLKLFIFTSHHYERQREIPHKQPWVVCCRPVAPNSHCIIQWDHKHDELTVQRVVWQWIFLLKKVSKLFFQLINKVKLISSLQLQNRGHKCSIRLTFSIFTLFFIHTFIKLLG